jgi:ATP-dependent DNA helicase RecG
MMQDYLSPNSLLMTVFKQLFADKLQKLSPFSQSRSQSHGQSRSQSRLRSDVLLFLENGPLSKSELSARLSHKEISGQLNKVIRLLLTEQTVEQTILDKPNSRLQKYRLTKNGLALLNSLQKGR